MEIAQTQPAYPKGLNFEQVWAALMENRNQQEKYAKEIRESQKETDRQIKDINKRFGEYSNRLGEIAEYMVVPNLCEKFSDLGLDFPKANRNTIVTDRINKIFFEIDVLLENGDKAILVEVKTNLTEKNIDAHIERMNKMRQYADLHGDKRSFLGAVAGVVIPENIRELALNSGFYVIEPSGETFNITLPYGEPKEW